VFTAIGICHNSYVYCLLATSLTDSKPIAVFGVSMRLNLNVVQTVRYAHSDVRKLKFNLPCVSNVDPNTIFNQNPSLVSNSKHTDE
jgi:hypothetical protein